MLVDTIPRAIKKAGADSRDAIMLDISRTNDPIRKAIGYGMIPLTHAGEGFAQIGNAVGAAAPGIALAEAVPVVGVVLASEPVVIVVTSLGVFGGGVNAYNEARNGTFSGSDAVFLLAPLASARESVPTLLRLRTPSATSLEAPLIDLQRIADARRATFSAMKTLDKTPPTRPSLAPDAQRLPLGVRGRPGVNDLEPENIRALELQNDSADILAKKGYLIEQLREAPRGSGVKNPDYDIEGIVFDHYAPITSNVRSIWFTVSKKVLEGQAQSAVVRVVGTSVDIQALRAQFQQWFIPGLREVIVITEDGSVVHIFPSQ